jgi:hypothetical protein
VALCDEDALGKRLEWKNLKIEISKNLLGAGNFEFPKVHIFNIF